MSSVATITASNFFARRQRSQTYRRSGLFPIRCSGFPGKRVERHRAGMIPTALFIGCLYYDLRGRHEIFGHPIRAAAVSRLVETSPNPDRADAGIVRAFGIDLLITDQKRPRKIYIVVTGGFENHSGRGFPAVRRLSRNVRTKIGRIDQIVSELPRNLCLYGAIFLFGKKATPDSALVGDHDDFVTGFLEPTQSRGGALEHLNLFGIGAIVGVVHDGAVAIDEDGRRL